MCSERCDASRLPDSARLLREADGPAVEIVNPEGEAPFVLICEHASNRIPLALDGLGVAKDVLGSHAAFDIGALAVARRVSERLDAPLVVQRFSRLVYDCNRPPEAPDAMPARSEIYEIPANAKLGEHERRLRISEIYEPFHASVDAVIEGRKAGGLLPVLVTIHSFTRVYYGKRRMVDFGVIDDFDTRLSDKVLAACADWGNCVVRRNEPYDARDGVTHSLRRHAAAGGLMNVMFEIANDLVSNDAGQEEWARRLSVLLREAAGTNLEERKVLEPGPHAT